MKRRVLIVDDEFGLAETMAGLLSERGLEVAIAMNGKLAWKLLDQVVPELVLLDVVMPVMDGPTLLAHMRGDPRFAQTPVVLMTSLPVTSDLVRDERYEVALQKPFTPEVLFGVIERFLGA